LPLLEMHPDVGSALAPTNAARICIFAKICETLFSH